MSTNKLPYQIRRICPICFTRYYTPDNKPAPTCGNPNCIREARGRGLPFTPPPILSGEKPSPVIKTRPGKARKSRS